MKNIFLIIILCFAKNYVANAQVVITPTITKPTIGTVYNGPWVTIFSKKDYQGVKKTITTNTTNVDAGFRLDTISIKIKPGYMVFLSVNCAEFSNEVALYENINQFVVSQNQICGLRIEKTIDYWVRLDGFLSQIHNNDCKKFYGNVSFKIFETNERNERTYYPIEGTYNYTQQVYNKAKTTNREEPSLFNINDYYLADRDYVNGVVWDASRYKPYITTRGSGFAKNNFKISETAYRNNKVFIEVSTKIGSHHKGCDLCTDFTKDAEMPREVLSVFNINSSVRGNIKFTSNIIQVGPFRAAPAGNTTFTGGGGFNNAGGTAYHTTYVQFTLKD